MDERLRDVDSAATGTPRRSTATAAAVAATLVCLLAVVALASRSERRAEDGNPAVPAVPAPVFDYAFTFGVLAVALLFGLALYLRVPLPTRPGGPQQGLLRAAIAVAVVGILLTLGLDNVRRPPPLENVVEDAVLGQGQRPAPGEIESAEAGRLEFKWKAAIGAAVVVAGAVGAYAVARRRARASAEDEPELAQELALVLDDTLEDLRRERDARRAVIAAYARMERTLATHGLPRRPFEAPLEYLARVLGALRVRSAAVLDLTSLFERAKFSQHAVDEAMKEEAIGALVAVREDLEATA